MAGDIACPCLLLHAGTTHLLCLGFCNARHASAEPCHPRASLRCARVSLRLIMDATVAAQIYRLLPALLELKTMGFKAALNPYETRHPRRTVVADMLDGTVDMNTIPGYCEFLYALSTRVTCCEASAAVQSAVLALIVCASLLPYPGWHWRGATRRSFICIDRRCCCPRS